jgi:hypothetical protein
MPWNHPLSGSVRWLLAAGLALLVAQTANSATASLDLTVPIVVCVPGNPQTMQVDNKLVSEGVVRRRVGRDPPPFLFFCPVSNSFTSAQPGWTAMQLMYQDNTSAAANIVVKLHRKSRGKLLTDPTQGTTNVIATLSSEPAVGVNVVTTQLRGDPIDFSRFSYYLTVEMVSPTNHVAPVIDAHEVRLIP